MECIGMHPKATDILMAAIKLDKLDTGRPFRTLLTMAVLVLSSLSGNTCWCETAKLRKTIGSDDDAAAAA